MKITLIKSLSALTLTTALTVMSVPHVHAETVEVRGQISYGYSFTPTGVEQYTTGHYLLEITQQPSMPLMYSASSWRQYTDALSQVKVTLFDAQGNEIAVRQPLKVAELTQPTNTLYFDFGRMANYASWTLTGVSQEQFNSQLNLNLRGPNQSLFESTAEFPRFVSSPRYVNATLFSSVETAAGDDALYLSGSVTDINYLTQDSDADGILDDVDACPASDISTTVVVGANDTGVTNSVDSVGCSISDKVQACSADAQSKGAEVSCVSHLAKQLRKEGIISNSDHGALLRHL
ncbi:hypothetical protein [Pseudidiomarina sp.]|uniref:hypothetical protein n=1 Tax=Pseudidiomarina sp. TaxID=2081707 RepID=UPI003A97C55A